MDTVTVYAATKESLEVVVTTTADPVGNLPEFSLSAAGASAPGGSWVAGSWGTTWSAASHRTIALTPLVGSAGALVVAAGTDYDLWARITVGAEVAVWPVARIHVP